MDIASDTQFMTTSHEKCISMWQLPDLDNPWNYSSNDPSEQQIRTQLDPTATVVISSSTAKTVTIFDAASGQPLVKCCPGEITTAMCLSTNAKQLITASDKGVIYIWRLPVDLTTKLVAAKTTPREIAVSACPKKELSDVLGQISNVANLINNIPSQESQELPAWAQQQTPSKVVSNSETKEVTRITQADFQKQESITDPPMVEANQPQIHSNEFENKP